MMVKDEYFLCYSWLIPLAAWGGGGAELGLRYAKSRYVKFQLLKQWKFVIALSIA